jgi:hypothetical protein
MPKQRIMERIGKIKEAEDFDLRFWSSVSSNVKFSALWKMVLDFYKMKGKNADMPGLRRSVEVIKKI